MLKAFGYHRELEPVLAEFLSAGERHECTVRFMQFVENAQTTVLGTVGFLILVYTVIVMIEKIEGALNFTWHVERPRSLARRVIEYMVIMLVGPVLVVAAMVLLTRIETSAMVSRVSGLAGNVWVLRHHVLIPADHRPVLVPVQRHAEHARAARGVDRRPVRRCRWVGVGAIFTRIAVYATQAAAIYAGFAIVLLFMVRACT